MAVTMPSSPSTPGGGLRPAAGHAPTGNGRSGRAAAAASRSSPPARLSPASPRRTSRRPGGTASSRTQGRRDQQFRDVSRGQRIPRARLRSPNAPVCLRPPRQLPPATAFYPHRPAPSSSLSAGGVSRAARRRAWALREPCRRFPHWQVRRDHPSGAVVARKPRARVGRPASSHGSGPRTSAAIWSRTNSVSVGLRCSAPE